MLNIFKKKSEETNKEILWDSAATAALEQALAVAPVPSLLKGKVKQELKKAAEEHARRAGRDTVTAEDLVQGLLARMPSGMKNKIEQAIKEGPDGVKRLQDDLKM